MYKCKRFSINELVPASVFADRGQKAWQLLDERALRILDLIAEKLADSKAATVNTPWNGVFDASGLRVPGQADYKPYSQHSFGRAFDVKIEGVTATTFTEWVIANINQPGYEALSHLGFIEYDTISARGNHWVHFDVRNNPDSVIVWSVKSGNIVHVINKGN